MTRRRFYAPSKAFSSDRTSAILSGDETRHLRDVLRLKAGDEIFLFDGAGREFQAEITSISRDSANVNVIAEAEPANPESPLAFTLATALLKGEKFDLVVQKATELGVTSLIPVITARADVRLKSDDDCERKVTRWRRIALEATKQCGRAQLMNIEKPMKFSHLIKTPSAPNDLHLMFAERGGDSLVGALGQPAKQVASVTALVGSEGGWDDDEIDQARGAGWQIVTLGGRTLRAETAAIVIAALIQNRFGDLK
ncbi:MAG: 16S rRNA (uracil(1498)-N(3))-methyltransferase [Pyrinomonadaceae bacterium]